jgi:cytochrome c5
MWIAMIRRCSCGLVILLAAVISLSAAPQQATAPAAAPELSPQRATLNRYCVTCHNEKLKTADLLLDQADVDHVSIGPETWEKVIKKLRTGAMPPTGAQRPDKATYDSLAGYLENELNKLASAQPNPGRPADHRLNRLEYTNAIRDLLAVEIDGASLLPPDDVSYGFDNIGDVLSVSPLLMERYMLAAGKITRLAVGDANIRPAASEYSVSRDAMQEDRASEDLPFGSRGGIAIKHIFPADGEYSIRVRLMRNDDGYIRGLTEPHQLDIRVDGARVKLFTVGGERHGRSGPIFTRNDPDYRGDPDQVAYEMGADDDLEVRFQAKAGTRSVGVTFLKEVTQQEGVYTPALLLRDVAKYKGGDPLVDSVTVTGPFHAAGIPDTTSRRRIFICSPTGPQDEDVCARKILTALARRAYRRPVGNGDVEPLVELYKKGKPDGGFDAGISLALQRVLAGPEFLFRIERDPSGVPPDTAYRVDDVALASRLSFFLWSSIPDDELLSLAEKGKLKDPAVLDQQVRRMLADPHAQELADNFVGQWLHVRNVRVASPDSKEFPDFDDELRAAFEQETFLLIESMFREDQSILNLLNSNYTYANERLARHYGIPNIYGSRFRRVPLADENRWGILGQGSVLTVTSRANRTSPVLRGKWVLDNLLGSPPPPPPPNVPPLEPKAKDGRILSIRQQMEQHRANPACAVCHSRMDPIGFALDNFNGVGIWRTMDAGMPLDTSGIMPDGTKFQGPAELRQAILSRPGPYITTVTEKLLTYALGRGLEYYDEPVVRQVIQEAAPSEYRWSALIMGIVKSTPFQMRRTRPS